ncbi:type II toxin-antitoxin system RatA family toxin [Hyphobacterium marinum]|uniref:Type II toxin-antitoxin system RatA family toxin n=1 Tax=Hyphobacterium marinum TaxID=3116574 RepID=A0ABU7LZ67_9PROT|nr:type II toxin-antitoxin system RatA family toxin [Hyphobacterium sp. Y6023]MEE2566582.1 type II toxin-antitoxin system RatA family toxin [Hyphobacterium sp. Y6023]
MSSRVRERLRIRHSPEDVYALVGDVEAYPKFINLITALRVKSREETERGSSLVAEAKARYKFVSERFVTRVTLDDIDHRINVELVKGPFRSLANSWQISALPDGSTLVDFVIDFEFSNPMLNMLLSANKERAVGFIIQAFKARADQLYPKVGAEEFDLDAASGASD